MSRTYLGEVRNGVIVLEAGSPVLPEGMKVQVEPVDVEADVRELWRGLRSLAGIAEGLPSDFAEQHDHYLHGTPKR